MNVGGGAARLGQGRALARWRATIATTTHAHVTEVAVRMESSSAATATSSHSHTHTKQLLQELAFGFRVSLRQIVIGAVFEVGSRHIIYFYSVRGHHLERRQAKSNKCDFHFKVDFFIFLSANYFIS